MSATPKKIPAEETLLFMAIITFTGGFINAFSYFTRGGAFVTFHTGNIARIGISAFTGDQATLLACIVPVIGGFIGAVLAQFLKVYCGNRVSNLRWQQTTLLAELAALLIAALLPATVPDSAVNFFLSVVAMFQLSNFRKYEGAVHNSTIQTGNLRTLGQHFANALFKHDKATVIVTLRYFLLMATFPFGLFAGGWLCQFMGSFSLLPCCALLAFLVFIWLPKGEVAAQKV